MRASRLSCALALLGLTVLQPLLATAHAGFRAHPVRLSIAPGDRVAELQVTNIRPRESLLQVSVLRWRHDEEGHARFAEAPEIIASPPVFRLDADARQIVRIGRREGKTPSRERAYRVVIEEVATGDADGPGLHMRMRMRLPLFIRPAAGSPELTFEQDAGCLQVRNEGKRHARLTELSVAPGTAQGGVWRELDISRAPYLLAGGVRCLPLTSKGPVERVRFVTRNAGDGERALD